LRGFHCNKKIILYLHVITTLCPTTPLYLQHSELHCKTGCKFTLHLWDRIYKLVDNMITDCDKKIHFKVANLGLISSTFYEQLLCMQILKAQKRQPNLTVFFVLLGSVHIKAARKTLMKLIPDKHWKVRMAGL